MSFAVSQTLLDINASRSQEVMRFMFEICWDFMNCNSLLAKSLDGKVDNAYVIIVNSWLA